MNGNQTVWSGFPAQLCLWANFSKPLSATDQSIQEKQEEETLITEKKKKPTLYLLVYQDKKMATSYHKIQEMSAECREIESTQRNQNWEKKWLMWKISGEDSGEKCGIYDWFQENWFQEISGSIYHPLSLISSLERLWEAELWYKMYKSHDYLVIGCKVGLIFFFMFSPFKNIYWWTWLIWQQKNQ